MKLFSLLAVTFLALSCSSSKHSGLDFSNVESTSLDAMHPSPAVVIVTKTTSIEERPGDFSNAKRFSHDVIQKDTIAPTVNYNFSNVKSISTDGMEPAPKVYKSVPEKREPSVPQHDPLRN